MVTMPVVRERLFALQVLRALAAGVVIYAHAQDTYITKVLNVGLPFLSYTLGDLGVKLFFCISGFMIHGAGSRMPAGLASMAEFAWRRVVRVVPLYWAATLVYAAKLALQGDPPTVGDYAGSLLFVAYGNYFIRPILGVGWTLNFEMFFYAVFAVSLVFRRGRGLWVASCFAFMFLLGRLGITAPFADPPASFVFLLTNVCLVYFLLGLLLGGLRSRYAGWVEAVSLSPVGALGLAAAAMCVYLVLLACVAARHPWPWWERWSEVAVVLAVVSMVGACLMEGAHKREPAQPVFGVLRMAGDASYGSYLTHGFVMGPSARLLALAGIDLSVGLFSVSMVLACTAMGMLVHFTLEKPLLRRFSRPPWLTSPPVAGFRRPVAPAILAGEPKRARYRR